MITTETENRTTKTEIELYVINKVKELRKAANLSQEKLSLEEKYNLNHINEIAKYFDVPIASLFPPQYLKTDCIEEYWEKHPKQRKKYDPKPEQQAEQKNKFDTKMK